MALWEVEVQTVGREVYLIAADTAEQAKKVFDDGEVTKPSMSEVVSIEAVEVRRAS